MRHFLLTLVLCAISIEIVCAQDIKVTLSPDKGKINRDVKDGVATVFFESAIKNLVIDNDEGDERISTPNGLIIYLIEPRSTDDINLLGYPKRDFFLKAPNVPEYMLSIDEIFPNTVLYYTVTLPNRFSTYISAEYLLSKTSPYGLRVSFGKQFGGYVSYKWGRYKKRGVNIAHVTDDNNLTGATDLGYIRTGITGGVRLGFMHKPNISLYALVGGGYGEYGRLWSNLRLVSNDTYFYSDYIKGFEGDAAFQCVLFKWMALSIGTDLVVGNGNVSVDYQIGVGINLDCDKYFHHRKAHE